MLQMLESFQIIDSTVKLNIFTQRLDFLGRLASSLPAKADKDKCINVALTTYANKYAGRPISPTIRMILNQPQIATSPKFRDEAATAFFLRSCDKFKTDITNLKTAAAQLRRVEQAAELSYIIKDRLISDEIQKYIDCIQQELANVTNLVVSVSQTSLQNTEHSSFIPPTLS